MIINKIKFIRMIVSKNYLIQYIFVKIIMKIYNVIKLTEYLIVVLKYIKLISIMELNKKIKKFKKLLILF